MSEKNVRSLEWRRKQSQVMHRMVSKLLKLKKRKALQYANQSVLKKRAQKLAHTILRKRIAGAQGSNYAGLSSSQKMAVDRMMQRVPATAVRKLATRLLPMVSKHEKERVMLARKHHNSKKPDETEKKPDIHGSYIAIPIKNEEVTHKQRQHIKAAAERTKHRRHQRTSAVIKTRASGEGKKTLSRLASRKSVEAINKRLGRGSGIVTKYGEVARKQMRARLSKGNATGPNVRKRVRDLKKKTTHYTKTRRGSDWHNTATINYLGGKLDTASYEVDCFADMLLERNMKKFEQLFLRGLVPIQKIEIYKRIFDDLEQNIRFRRYHDEIIDIIDTMIKLITTDNSIYYRIRNNIQKKKVL